MDVIKERLQVQMQVQKPLEFTNNIGAGASSSSSSGSSSSSANIGSRLPIYKGSFDALLQICRQEGVRGIYKGYGATLLTYGPFSALYFFLYEEVEYSAILLPAS